MLKHILKILIKGLRPLLGPEGLCKFELSCTDYAILQLQDNNLFKACFKICKRVIKCNPLTF